MSDEKNTEVERLRADNRSQETLLVKYADKVHGLRAEIERLELEVAAWKQASDLKAVEIERLQKLVDPLRMETLR
jgi:hypothetical protein